MHSAFIISFTSDSESDVKEMIQGYMKEIEELRAKLLESEAMCQQLPQASSRFLARMPFHTHMAMTGELQANLLLTYIELSYEEISTIIMNFRKIESARNR
jgi:hypothetical protein